MSITPLIYASTDPDAPQISGQLGSLVAILDAVLVNGYGTGVNAKPGAGWTIEAVGANRRIYRNCPISGSGRYLSVNDNGLTNARVAHLRAAEACVDVDTLVNPAPTVGQEASGSTWAKSHTLDAVSRGWVVIATCRWFYLFVNSGNRFLPEEQVPNFAGDLDSPRPDDVFAFCLSMGAAANYAGATGANMSMALLSDTTFTAARGSHGYVLRPSSMAAGATVVSAAQVMGAATVSALGARGMEYPYRLDGGLWMQRVVMMEGANMPRGWLPGCYAPCHEVPLPNMAVESTLSGWPGRSFLAKRFWTNLLNSSLYRGQVLFDITPEAD